MCVRKAEKNFMTDKIELDLYSICLEVTDYSPNANVRFWLDCLAKNIQGKIHIVAYRTIKQEIQNTFVGEKFVWKFELAKTYDEIDKYIGAQDKNDAIIIVGAERLTKLSSKKHISSLTYDNKDSNLHFQEDEDWAEFAKQVDCLYEKHLLDISGLVLICNVNDTIADAINGELENSKNMSIYRTEIEGYDCSSSDNATRVIKEIENTSLQEALDIINANVNTMSSEHMIMCQAIAYHSNGNITKAIDLLDSIYDTLTNEQKLFLAEMYILQERTEDAKEVFEDVYANDKWQRGLYELGLDAYGKHEQRYVDILTEGIRCQPDNEFLIERYANLLVNQGKHREAAVWFRKIKNPYFELIARVNDLLAENQLDAAIIRQYLFEIVENNPELKNVALYKIAMYAKEHGHYYRSYNLLREADLTQIDDVTKDILKEKIDILGDTEKASKALGKLKPYKKERDRTLLLKKRCGLLLECINYFSHKEFGYSYWRDLIGCQQIDTWNVSLKTHLIRCVHELSKMDLFALLPESYISNLEISKEHLNCDTAISLLRLSHSGEVSAEEIGCTREEVVQGSWNLIEMGGTDKQRIWLRYYCSIGASILNENPQDANNFSLSIFEFGKTAEKKEQDLIVALYLMSWANAQYRLGNCIEGIACAMVAIKQLLKIKEVTPILEEGLNLVAKYLGTYEDIFNEEEKREVTGSIRILKKHNESLIPLLYKYSDNTDEIVLDYEEKVKSDSKNISWLMDLGNLINGKVLKGETDEAIRYIKDNYILAEKLLEQRKDIATQMLFSWGDIVIKFGNGIENLMLGLDLFDMSLTFIDKRRQVYHQEERASLAEIYDKILREYLCFAGVFYSAKDISKEIKAELRNRICKKMALCIPLSVVEQKKYNKEKNISADLEEKHYELQHLKKEYAIMLKNNSIESVEVNNIARRIENLSKELVQCHPYYMPLSNFQGTNWVELQSALKSNEIVYQYVLTEMAVVSILVTKEWIDVRSQFFSPDGDTPYSGMEKYGHIVEESEVGDNELDFSSAIISEVVAKHLCEYVFNYDVERIYIIPDISKSVFPFSAVRYDGKYLIDKVEEIINFIDYEQLLNSLKAERSDIRIVNKIFGKKEDPSIRYIKNWLDSCSMENVINITDCADDFSAIVNECDKGANTVVIYGHGAKDPASVNIEGAQELQGANSMISIRKLLEAISAKNLILISCVGGTPNSINPEMSSGTWTSIFERFNGNIIACRWSVPTVDTIEMMKKIYENLLEEKMTFSKALLMAQRDMKNNGKKQLSWAGVECWIN